VGTLALEDVVVSACTSLYAGAVAQVHDGLFLANRSTFADNEGGALFVLGGFAQVGACTSRGAGGRPDAAHVRQRGGAVVIERVTFAGAGTVARMEGGTASWLDVVFDEIDGAWAVTASGGNLLVQGLVALNGRTDGVPAAFIAGVDDIASIAIEDATLSGFTHLVSGAFGHVTLRGVDAGFVNWDFPNAVLEVHGGGTILESSHVDSIAAGGFAQVFGGELRIERTLVRRPAPTQAPFGGAPLTVHAGRFVLDSSTIQDAGNDAIRTSGLTEVMSSTIAGSRGAGLRVLDGEAIVTSATIAANAGGGIVQEAAP